MTNPTDNREGIRKPKLVFFQYKYDQRLPAFLLMHKQEHVTCLAQFFDVTVINEDCDYQQVCDQYQPDIAFFESGVPNPACRRPEIRNSRACPEIPKLGFLHADGYCSARAGFLSDMDHLGIETFFAIATTAAEHIPAVADRLFIWPNFVVPEIYHDYGEWKNIPVLFTGNTSALYPWRQKIIRLVSKQYPSLICRHPGYSAVRDSARTTGGNKEVAVGQTYARMLNTAWFVPSCGAVAKEVVRKHFEIPACHSCLIAEKSAALEAAGFVDMENCVFADKSDVLDKMDFLFKNPDTLNEIIDAGHRLVHSRHTIQHRDQVLQWFNLQQSLKPNQTVIQTGPFEPLRIAEKSTETGNIHISCDGIHLRLLREGDRELRAGNYAEAETLYLRSASYIHYMPEPKVKLALCNLYRGNARKALSYILEPVQFTLAEYRAVDPDPVEWAYFIVSLLCLGKVGEAVKHAEEFPWLRHPELDRVRWVTGVLSKGGQAEPLQEDGEPHFRASLHAMPGRSLDEWIAQLCIMLRACGQGERANALIACRSRGTAVLPEGRRGQNAGGKSSPRREGISPSRPGNGLLALGRPDVFGFFKRRLLYSKARSSMKQALRSGLHRMETKYRYFLPYHLSAARNDEFFQAIQDLARDEDIKTALVIGAASGQGLTEALLAGAAENENSLSVFCLSTLIHRLPSIPKPLDSRSLAKWYQLSAFSPENLSQEIEKSVGQIKEQNHIDSFDLVLIDGSEMKKQVAANDAVVRDLHGARFVLLDDIVMASNCENHVGLLADSSFELAGHNPGLRNGYSIFKRKMSAQCEAGSL